MATGAEIELARLKSRIDELEILNEELTDLYNKHMRSWAEREKAQDVLLDEAYQRLDDLEVYIENELMEFAADEDRKSEYRATRQLKDRIRNRKNGGK